jgi:hypothetical protein
MVNAYRILVGIEHLGNREINVRMLLKRILKKLDIRQWTGFNWLMTLMMEAVALKRRSMSTRLQGATSQKTVIFISQ